MDEGGATYQMKCVPYPMHAFEDDTCGRVPDAMSVGGKTIQEFCDNFAEALTKKWKERYLAEIYTFKVKIQPIADMPDSGKYSLTQSEIDPVRNLKLDEKNKIPQAQIARGTTISDVITFLYCNCEEMQRLMLDTNSSSHLEDTNGDDTTGVGNGDESGIPVTFNKKDYRVPIIPMIEADIKVIGYDPVTGHYMKEITYNIWGYRTYASNMCVSQFDKIRKNAGIAVKITEELKKRNYLKKRYEYRFTGMNTEVLRFDLNYNFSFSAVLPKINGWRSNIKTVSLHEKQNPALKNNASMADQKNENKADPKTLSDIEIGQQLNTANDTEDSAKDVLADENATAEAKANAQRDLNAAEQDRARLAGERSARLSKSLSVQKATRENIEAKGPSNIYAEDADSAKSSVGMTYIQSNDEGDNVAGVGFLGQWHRGASLTGALMNQLYSDVLGKSLAVISLEIRGDPYWIGYSLMERRAIMGGGHEVDTNGNLPNYSEGDATFALIFRFPAGIGQDGRPVIRQDDVFNGLYKVRGVKSIFSNGSFTQTLDATKLELISTAAQNANPDESATSRPAGSQ